MFVTCVGTPVPVPMPINEKMVQLSASSSGKVVVAGHPEATEFGNTVRVENTRTHQSFTATVSAGGSFALLVEAETADLLQIRTALGERESEPLALSVPSDSKKPLPAIKASTVDKDGRVTLTGNVREKAIVVGTLLRTGEVAIVETPDNGEFQLTLSAQADESLFVFIDYGAQGISQYLEIIVPKQSPTACLDKDGDHYGASGTDISLCSGSTTLSDCNDAETNVHPGQTQFFTQAISAPASGKAFDYNCDGQEEKQYAVVGSCLQSQGCTGEGWISAVPECGQQGTWAQCVQSGKGGCVAQTMGARTQSCR